ncbi:MAG: hypothetical protein Q8T11_14370, partial [Elusimicrobiota bacterium]|nr:hypothetical protein [Elusimicrobiota bacterium]
MEEDKRLQAAGALVAIIGLVVLVVQFAANRPAASPSAGPGWHSRYNPFGSAPSSRPGPHSPPADGLAPPERMMTNAATRLFSSPAPAGSVGGLPGAEAPSPQPRSADASFSPPRLAGSSVDIPGGGRAPVSGGLAAPPPPSPGGRAPAPSAGSGGGP